MNKLADKFADLIIQALRPKLEALLDDQIARAKRELESAVPAAAKDALSASAAIRKAIGL